MFVPTGKRHERGTTASTHINNTGARAAWKGFVGLVVGAVIGFAFVPGIVQAESFSKLEKRGFDVGNSPKARPAAMAESSRTAIGGSSAS
ncbi:hypothetical protein [Rhizobium brockwellii]